MTQYNHIGEKLRALRKSAGLRLHHISTNTGLSISRISEIEKGLNDPSLSALCKFADTWGVSLSQLFEDVPTQSQTAASHAAKE